MKNLLIITAHPSSRNLTKGISNIYKEEKEAQGYEVDLVDLYEDKQLPYLRFEDVHTDNDTEERRYYQEKISKADEILIVYPFWWGTIPGILKNWLDIVLTAHFAVKYENSRPVGLLQGKSVRVISTSGAPTFYYCLNGIRRANKKIWKQTIINFCGMQFDGFHLYGGMDTSSKKVEKMFASVKKLANS